MTNDKKSLSEIQNFFYGTNVFLTGATGFIGHVLVEKLLRSCMINKIYLLVRPKKDEDPQTRLCKMFSAQLFKILREEQPDFLDKVLLITGDCTEPHLGLSVEDEEFLVANIDIVIHCAATINLNGPLKRTTLINVRSTRDLLLIAQRMHRLKSFVFVSTAFSNPNQPITEEIIYKCHIQGDNLINMAENMSESMLNLITPECLGTWPNTYTLSKCVAENIIEQYGQNMPICITRPCIVSFTQDEPIPGWVTTLKSVPGLCLGIGLGAIHVAYGNEHTVALVISADKVANMIISSAWHASKSRSELSIPVFNYVPSNMPPLITYGKGLNYIVQLITKYKLYSKNEVWKPSLVLTESNLLFTILFFLFHYIPAYLADFFFWITGRKLRVAKLYTKLKIMMEDMKFFGTTDFKFNDSNLKALISSQSIKDKKLFDMDISNINWEEHFLKCIRGIRQNMFNEPSDNTAGLERHKKIMLAYYILNSIMYGSLFYLIYILIIK